MRVGKLMSLEFLFYVAIVPLQNIYFLVLSTILVRTHTRIDRMTYFSLLTAQRGTVYKDR